MIDFKSSVTKLAKVFLFIFTTAIIIEIAVNAIAEFKTNPIKNANSYGYVDRQTQITIVPLNKYHSRIIAALSLPLEYINAQFYNKDLTKSCDRLTNKYGYIDDKGNLAIDYKFDEANKFEGEYAIVAININKSKKYGTINKKGDWVIEPKYSYICPLKKNLTKVCIDKEHCGVLDRYGNEITVMSYSIDRLHCKGNSCIAKFCSIGENENLNCGYFL